VNIWTYIIRRLLLLIPTIFIVTVIVFLLCRFLPGDVIELLLTQMQSEAAGSGAEIDISVLQRALGLDVPVHIQYGRWIGVLPYPDKGFDGLLQGSLGYMFHKRIPVAEEFLNRWPVTLELGILSIIIGACVALPIGIGSAIRQDRFIDYGGRSFAILMMSLPSFWLATIVIVYASKWFGWMTRIEYIPFMENPIENLKMFWLPGLLMGSMTTGVIMRLIRTSMLEVLRQDYIRTAWAKGLSERTVVLRHGIRNAFIPVITVWGGMLGSLIGGSVIIEQIFCLPGLGRMTLDALSSRDYPTIQAMNLIMTTFVMLNNLVIDVLYGVLDPRVRFD